MIQTRILDGRVSARKIQEDVRQGVAALKGLGIIPGLATVLVGDDPASSVYVRSKSRTCMDLGMNSKQVELPSNTSEEALLEVIRGLNESQEIDGILVQLPLPAQIDETHILKAVLPEKDVDGFHPFNVGRLVSGNALLAPCTPMGVMEMLRLEGVPLEGAEAVIVGRSNIVGKPMALLLLHANATVTICHSRTRNLPDVCRRADILIAAIGRPGYITRDFIKEGSVVVDVGVNRIETHSQAMHLFGQDSERLEAFEKRGSVLVGDVHPTDPFGIASAITPVPGGVGPLTIAHLMKNTLLACKARRNL